jgi:anti-sigma factor RsiW
MNCHAVRAVSDLHAEGRLTPSRAHAVAAHLDGCSACRADATRFLPPTASRPTPAALNARLLAAAKNARPEPTAVRTLSLLPRDVSSVLWAAVALALVALVVGWHGAPNQSFLGSDEIAGRTR